MLIAWVPQELRKRLGCQQSLLTEWEAAGERVSDQLLWRWVRAKGSLLAAESCISQHALWRIQLGTITEVRSGLNTYDGGSAKHAVSCQPKYKAPREQTTPFKNEIRPSHTGWFGILSSFVTQLLLQTRMHCAGRHSARAQR